MIEQYICSSVVLIKNLKIFFENFKIAEMNDSKSPGLLENYFLIKFAI